MKILINIDRLHIYRKYGGDIDGLLRVRNPSDLDVLGPEIDEIWGKITNFTQDIALIEKGLASTEYIQKTINEIKTHCDKVTFEELTKTIHLE